MMVCPRFAKIPQRQNSSSLTQQYQHQSCEQNISDPFPTSFAIQSSPTQTPFFVLLLYSTPLPLLVFSPLFHFRAARVGSKCPNLFFPFSPLRLLFSKWREQSINSASPQNSLIIKHILFIVLFFGVLSSCPASPLPKRTTANTIVKWKLQFPIKFSSFSTSLYGVNHIHPRFSFSFSRLKHLSPPPFFFQIFSPSLSHQRKKTRGG